MNCYLKQKNWTTKILTILLALALCMGAFGLPTFAKNVDVAAEKEVVQLAKLEFKVLSYDPNGEILENIAFDPNTKEYNLKLNRGANYGIQAIIGTQAANPNVKEVTCSYTNQADYTSFSTLDFGDAVGNWDNQITNLKENSITVLSFTVKATAESGLADNTYIVNLTKGCLPENMTAKYVAENELGALQMPAQNSTSLTMPTVPKGFTIAIQTSGDETTLQKDGTIIPPQVERIIPATFKISKDKDSAISASFEVTIPQKTLGASLGKVTIAAEKFNVQGGYDKEPCQVDFYTNDTGYHLLQRLVGGDKNLAAYTDGTWKLVANNVAKTDFAAYIPQANDVIRLQAGEANTTINRDALTKELGRINSLSNKNEYLSTAGVQEKYNAALAAIKDLTKTQREIDTACEALIKVLNGKLAEIAATIKSETIEKVLANQEQLTMPTVPNGYTIAIDEATVSPVGAVEATGKLILPEAATAVTFQFTVTENATTQTTNTATISLNIPQSSYENNDLKLLKLADYGDKELTLTSTSPHGTNKTGFYNDVTNYTAQIAENNSSNQDRIEWKATAAKAGATIKMYYTTGTGIKKEVAVESGNTGWSFTTPDNKYIFGGDNKIEFVVTPRQGAAKTYTIIVQKPEQAGANGLSKLELLCDSQSELIQFSQLDKDGILYQKNSDNLGDKPKEGFVPTIKEYTASVNNSVAKIKLQAQGEEGNIGFKIGETNFAGGTTSNTIPLEVGENEIKIEATKSGVVFDTYKIKVTRLPELTFDAISLSTGSIEKPTDAPGYRKIIASVPKTTTNYDLTITAQPNITIAVDGTIIPSNQPLTLGYEFQTEPTAKNIVLTKTINGKTITSSYTLQVYGKEQGAPSKVLSYLPAPGQYTNSKSYGIFSGLTGRGVVDTSNIGGMVSLGSLGGSITYEFADSVLNSQANKFGIDFIVYGNAFYNSSEPAAVYVAQKNAAGEPDKWYALAGSEHYEDSTIWDYTVTYTNPDPKFEQNKAVDIPWQDNQGNTGVIKGNSFHKQPYYPQTEIYKQQGNPKHTDEQMTVSSINLGSKQNGAFGYADVHPNNYGDYNKPVNPYALSFDWSSASGHRGDGMDISWAVDDQGLPIKLDKIDFVKLSNATLLSLGMMGDVSAEISAIRTVTPEEKAVGTTTDLKSLAIKNADGSQKGQTLTLKSGQINYEVQLGAKQYVTLTPQGIGNENIYLNNEKLAYDETNKTFQTSKVFQITKDSPKLVRIIAQNEEKEPVFYLIKLTSTAEKSNTLLSGLNLDCYGAIRAATKNNDTAYSSTVGYAVSAIKIAPQAEPETTVSINDQTIALGQYSTNLNLNVGENSFTIKATKGDKTENITLKVTRETSPTLNPDKKITVNFCLVGDEKHGEIQKPHTYVQDGNKMPIWISTSNYTVNSGSTVKDVFEKALADADISYVNLNGNYVSAITAPQAQGGYWLKEMDNGGNSGWMYLLNNKHSTLGLAEQVLADGDSILWHYTDDYTKEQGSLEWGSGNTGKPEGNPSGKTETIQPNITTDKNGTATVVIDKKTADAALAAIKQNNSNQLVIAPNIQGAASKVLVTLPKTTVADLNKQTKAILTIQSELAKISFSSAALTTLAKASGDEIGISVTKLNHAQLSAENQKLVGNHPVYDFSITVGNKQINQFQGLITVSLPYTPQAGEDFGKLTIYYIDQAGNPIEMVGAKYDAATKSLIFTTNHFSTFAIAYAADKVIFSDVPATHWAAEAISYLANKQILTGKTATTFAPNDKITRAEFATILARMSGDKLPAPTNCFVDVQSDHWFAASVAWAVKSGIAKGDGTKFLPNAKISREEMAVMLSRYADYKKFAITTTNKAIVFADEAQISQFAKAAVSQMQQAGIINGKENNTFAPADNGTRAEAAKMLSILLKQITDK